MIVPVTVASAPLAWNGADLLENLNEIGTKGGGTEIRGKPEVNLLPVGREVIGHADSVLNKEVECMHCM